MCVGVFALALVCRECDSYSKCVGVRVGVGVVVGVLALVCTECDSYSKCANSLPKVALFARHTGEDQVDWPFFI